MLKGKKNDKFFQTVYASQAGKASRGVVHGNVHFITFRLN